MNREQTELRAERLRVAVAVLDVAPEYDAGLYPDTRPVVSRHDASLFQTCSTEDRLLAEACLDAQRAQRRREWRALELLLAAIPPGGVLRGHLRPARRAGSTRVASGAGMRLATGGRSVVVGGQGQTPQPGALPARPRVR